MVLIVDIRVIGIVLYVFRLIVLYIQKISNISCLGIYLYIDDAYILL